MLDRIWRLANFQAEVDSNRWGERERKRMMFKMGEAVNVNDGGIAMFDKWAGQGNVRRGCQGIRGQLQKSL